MQCPGFECLIDYLDGRLAAAQGEGVQSHLEGGCARCQSDRAFYEHIKMAAAADDLAEPPAWVLKRAFKIFDAQGGRRKISERIGRLIATLVFDSRSRVLLAGVRSAEADARQMLYRAEAYSIDLRVDCPEQTRADLTGQILREDELRFDSVAGLALTLIRDGETISSAITNDRGEFTIGDLDCGQYDLQIEAGECDITIVGLPVF
jgi:hypothetical protein